jgi:protein-disulfide isomerase
MKEVELLKKKKAWYKRWWGITVIVFLVFLVLFLALFAYQVSSIYKEKRAGSYLTGEAPYNMELFVDELSPSWGNDDAVVKIVEFGDFNCSRCLQFYPVQKRLKEKYEDKIKFYWRNYPVVKESSANFALAGICAERQGLFWPLHDRFFQLQGTISLGDIEQLAEEVGVDLEKYKECLDHSLTMSQLRKDYFAAQDGEVRGTPSFIINGYKLEGAIAFEAMDTVIQKFLTTYESDNAN